MNDLQATVQNLLEQAVEQGLERGAQATIYYRGELVVDAFAGIADVRTGEKVTGETLFPVFSTTKGIAATLVHRLAGQGTLDYETPIAHYWPEFAAQDKSGITVRHALSHTAGLPLMPLGVGFSEICDWDLMCQKIADLQPISRPGERTEYHAITFSWILGETMRRADGRAFEQLLHEEICAPLGIETMFCGLPAELEPRVAWLEDENRAGEFNPDEPAAIPAWLIPLGGWMNRSDARRACIPASNGIMNARAIARHYAALLPGGVDGVELLTPDRVALALAPQPAETGDEPPKFGLGYGLGAAFGHGGYGGSIGSANPENGWSFGFTRNRMGEGSAAQSILAELEKTVKS